MGFKLYFKLILKRVWIIVLLMTVVLVSTYFFTNAQPLSYTAKATLLINPKVPSSLIPYADSASNYTAGLAQNYTLIMQSNNFAARVAEKLGFPIDLDALKKSYTSALLPNSLFFVISGTSDAPEKAVKIANEVTNLFLSEGIAKSNSNSSDSDIVNSTIQDQRDALVSLQTEIANLKKEIANLQQTTQSAGTALKLNDLRKLLNDDLNLQSTLVTSISNFENGATATPQASATLVDAAQRATINNGDTLPRNLLFAAILSLVLGIGIIILLDYLDYTVRTSESLSTLTGIPTLGVVPVIKINEGKPKSGSDTKFAADSSDSIPAAGTLTEGSGKINPSIITAIEFKSAASESYRVLRTNILFSELDDEGTDEIQKSLDSGLTMNTTGGDKPKEEDSGSGSKAIMITSALPQEGKSLTAANLAVAFAQAGNRVILVDADLRLPTMHQLFNVTNDNGFSDLLIAKQVQFEKFVKQTTIPNLFVITAGTTPPNPSELLTNSRTSRIITTLRKVADVIIFDTPPAMLAADASVLAGRVDSVLLVVRAGSTRRDTVLKTLNRLKKVGAHVSGTILNRLAAQDDAGYYSYNYYSGYSGSSKKEKADKEKVKAKSSVE